MIHPQDAAEGAELAGLLADLEALAAGRARVTLGETLAAIGTRGFGPVLVVLALLLILPLGMFSGVPGVVALTLGAVAMELALGNRALRPPRRIRDIALPARQVAGIAARLRPMARVFGRFLRPRAPALAASRGMALLLSAVLAGTAVVVFVLGFIPGLPFALAWPILLLGLGLALRDSLALGLGLALYLPAGFAIWRLVAPGSG